jgi:hypothetical protein
VAIFLCNCRNASCVTSASKGNRCAVYAVSRVERRLDGPQPEHEPEYRCRPGWAGLKAAFLPVPLQRRQCCGVRHLQQDSDLEGGWNRACLPLSSLLEPARCALGFHPR